VAEGVAQGVHQGPGRHPGSRSGPDVEPLDQVLDLVHRQPSAADVDEQGSGGVVEVMVLEAGLAGGHLGLQHLLQAALDGDGPGLAPLARSCRRRAPGVPSSEAMVDATASPSRMPVTQNVATRARSRSGQGSRPRGSGWLTGGVTYSGDELASRHRCGELPEQPYP
jgi:hypothetical protein